MKEINIGILGLGTVGTGIAKILLENESLITSRLGAKLILKRAADLDLQRDRGITFKDGVLTTDPFEIVDDPDIEIILEMIGGETIALFKAAAAKGVTIAFEPSVAGCMPIIKTLRETLVANHIQSICGILNGTCNYILSKITDEGVSFESALAGAQAEGFAEADPTLDIEGFDTAHKLAILSSIAFGMEINLKDIYVEGITKITPMDIDFADQYGYKIKLLAITKFAGESVEARVHPTMIPLSNPLSNVNGSLNAVTISGDAVGDMMLYGHGAGMMPTASAAISDIVDISRALLNKSVSRVPMLSFQTENIRNIPIHPIDEISSIYYFRFSALDQPGVLSKISGILGDHDISIKSVHQTEQKLNGAVPIFMLTHQAREAQVKKALAKIASLEVIADEPLPIRIEG